VPTTELAEAQRSLIAARRERLEHVCRMRSVHAVLITNPANVHYLTGFRGQDALLVTGRKLNLLLTDSRFIDDVGRECPDLEAYVRRPGEPRRKALVKVIRKARLKKLGFESESLVVSEWEALRSALPEVKWVGLAGDVERLRAVKDRHELTCIRHAVRIAEQAFGQLRQSWSSTESEKSVADRLEGLIRRAGGTRAAFSTIVASGERSAVPHAIASPVVRCNRRFVLIDWGAHYSFYHSDLTRVLAINKIPAKLAKVYEVVAKAQRKAIEAIRPGVAASKIDAVARGVIIRAGLERWLRHSVGHGLGLRVHEAPALRPNSADTLEAGMVVTIEPGVYIRDWGGIRIEDDVLVTQDGFEVLSTLTRSLEELIVTG
jgi:Xaa-Pro aminopeptidase